jgi:hypothetical protein
MEATYECLLSGGSAILVGVFLDAANYLRLHILSQCLLLSVKSSFSHQACGPEDGTVDYRQIS